jgi:hypothetical protein
LGEPTGTRYDSHGTNHLSQTFGNIIGVGVNNGDLEAWTGNDAANWTETVAGTSTITQDNANQYAGTACAKFAADASNSAARMAQSGSLSVLGKLYKATCYAKADATTGSPTIFMGDNNGIGTVSPALTTGYVQYTSYFRPANGSFRVNVYYAPSRAVYIDNVTLQSAELLAAPGVASSQSDDANFSASLNGTNQYFTATDNASLSCGGDISFTVGAWVYLNAITTTDQTILGKWIGGDLEYVLTVYQGMVFSFSCMKADNSLTVNKNSIPGNIVAGKWFFVVAQHDAVNNELSLFVDNAAQGSAVAFTHGGVRDGTAPFQIGRYSTGQYWNGLIDNAFVIKRLLTDAEKTFLFNNGQGRQFAELGIAGTDGANLTGFAGFWEFDNTVNASNQITSGTDSSGNGNHLSPAGNPTRAKGVNYYAGAVSRWEDRSGRGNHFTQGTISKYPALVSAGIGGKPAVDFDGVDDLLAAASFSDATQGTVFVVALPRNVGASQAVLASRDEATATRNFYAGISNGAKQYVYHENAGAATAVVGDDSLVADTPYVLAWKSDGSSYTFWRNGDPQTLTAAVGSNNGNWWGDVSARDNFTVGGSKGASEGSWFNGLVAEVLVYETALTDAQRQRVERYLAKKYGITLGA